MTQAAVLASNASLMTTPSGTAPSFLSRAWVNFNGQGTVAIRASGNVSSITDNGTGDYTVNFTTAMPDINYSTSLMASALYGVDRSCHPGIYTNVSAATEVAPTTSAARVSFAKGDGTQGQDLQYICVSIFR